jgi:GT2 family glycosyltransferase
MSGDRSRVTVVVVNWNTSDLLDECLASLRDDRGACQLDVIVVDNGSSDDSLAMLASRWPEVGVIANPDNRGFSAANNQGIAAATGDYVLLLNSDAALLPGCLDAMLDRMARDPRAGVVGPRLVYGDGSFQRWTAGRVPSVRSALAFALFFDRLFPRAGMWLGRDVSRAFQPEWVSAACLLVRREVFDDIGSMSERFFYMEDVDLCERAARCGWHVWYEPGVTAVHLMGQSSQRATGAASPRAIRSLIEWFALRNRRAATFGMRGALAIGFLVRAAIYRVLATRRPAHAEAARNHIRNTRLAIARPFEGAAR